MANGNLPNPAFGNDPATLLGSLIVEIGDLQQDQKATTARIENLDENEDRSTTLIENAPHNRRGTQDMNSKNG